MLADARSDDGDFGSRMAAAQQVMVPVQSRNLTPRQVGDLFGTLITAQPGIEKRSVPVLMQTLKVLAETFGDDYIYSWDVKDKNSKRQDGKTTIEGATVQLTNDLAREFGNCQLESRSIDEGTHWEIYSRFCDLQTGYSITRGFRQRKNAVAGKYEDDRKLDMAYQIGQSKSQRNVVVNALRSYSEYMVKIAKGALISKIQEDKEYYLDRIRKGLPKFNIGQQSAEAVVGSTMKDWDVRDIARVFSALKAVAEGLVDAKEAFPQDGPRVDDDGVVDETQTSAQATAADSGKAGPAASSEAQSAGADESGSSRQPADDAEEKPKSTIKKSEAKATAAEKPAADKPADKKPPVKKPAALF
ncbi:MAG: hypothetical protein WCP82_12090 [Alphaproteobacteria bacterium]